MRSIVTYLQTSLVFVTQIREDGNMFSVQCMCVWFQNEQTAGKYLYLCY